MNSITFNRNYFTIALLLLLIEIAIALFFHDKLIRPYGGDFLVVILVYCFVKSFFNFSVFNTSFSVLFFAYLIEISQYFHLIDVIGYNQSKIVKSLIGHSFGWIDMIAYTLGIIVVLIVEKFVFKNKMK